MPRYYAITILICFALAMVLLNACATTGNSHGEWRSIDPCAEYESTIYQYNNAVGSATTSNYSIRQLADKAALLEKECEECREMAVDLRRDKGYSPERAEREAAITLALNTRMEGRRQSDVPGFLRGIVAVGAIVADAKTHNDGVEFDAIMDFAAGEPRRY